MVDPLTPERPKRVRREYNRGWADGHSAALDACNPIIEDLQRQLAAASAAAPAGGDLRAAVTALRDAAHESRERFVASKDWSLADKADGRQGALYDVLALIDRGAEA